MKRETVPTSPQYPQTDHGSSHHPLWWALSIIVLGLLSGSVASLVITTSLLSEYNIQAQQIVIETTGSGTTLGEIAATVTPSMRERVVSVIDVNGNVLAQGLVVTTDGWIVTPHALQAGESIINSKRQVLEITNTQQDSYTSLYFLKTKQTALPVVTWATEDEISVGQRGVVMQLSPVEADWMAERSIATLHTAAHTEQSLRQLTDFIELDSPVSVVPGALVMGLNAHVFGMMNTNQQLIPGPVIERRLNYFIEHDTFQELPDLSVRSLFYDPAEGKSGFLVTRSTVPELQVGDSILALDGQTVSKLDQLSTLFFNLTPGADVTLEVQRSGIIQNVRVEL